MALYSIENDTCLGITHSGGAVNVESEGYVELSDEEVAKIGRTRQTLWSRPCRC